MNSKGFVLLQNLSNPFVSQVDRIVAESDDNEELTDLFIKAEHIQFMILALIINRFAIFESKKYEQAGKIYDNGA